MKLMSIFVVRKLVFTINAVFLPWRMQHAWVWQAAIQCDVKGRRPSREHFVKGFTFKFLKLLFYLGFSHMFIVNLRTDSVAWLKLVTQTTIKWLENNVWNDDGDDDGGIGVVWCCCRRIARERLGKAWHRPVTYYKTKDCCHRLRLVNPVKVVYFDPYDKKAASYD